jgi:hypothetical protein
VREEGKAEGTSQMFSGNLPHESLRVLVSIFKTPTVFFLKYNSRNYHIFNDNYIKL